MFLPQSGILGYTRGITPIPVPNQVTSRTTSIFPFTVGTNDWQGRGFPFKNALGEWGFVWVESTQHSAGTVSEWRCNIAFSNDEGATWTDNNEYFGSVAVTGFPLAAQAVGASFVNEVQVILCPNGELVLLAFDRSATYTNVSWSQWRSIDHGETWTFQFDFCDQLSGILANNKVQAVYEHMISGTTIYFTMMEFDTDINDTRIMLYKSEDNCATYDFVSNVVAYDEADPDCTESSIADLGTGNFFCVLRTQDLGQAVWKKSNDYGVTWGPLTEFSSIAGYVGIHQPRVIRFSNFFLLCGRDNKKSLTDPSSSLFDRCAFWTTTDLFVTARRQYLDPYYAGNGETGITNEGDAGYARFLTRDDGSFVFFGYYGTVATCGIYLYEVSYTNTPSTENYSNIEFFPETLTNNGFRLQLNRDNFFEPAGVSPALGGLAVISRAHNTLTTGSVYWTAGGTDRPEFAVFNDRGWAIFNGTARLLSVTSIGTTLFSNSFSIGVWVWPDDGNPAATSMILRDTSIFAGGSTLDMVQLFLFTDGRIRVTYTINNVTVTAETANAIFANGAVATPVHIAATFTSGELIRIYVDGVLQGYNGANTGDISGLTMASYTNGTNQMSCGQRQTGASTFDLGFAGKLREVMCQPVVWSAGDITNIMLN